MRIRLRFSKLGKVRFTSHRDVARMFERALRRDRFPVAYSAGFSPRPQISFGLALPTGSESLAEYLDVTVDEGRPEAAELRTDDFPARLSRLLPEGVDVTAAAPVAERAGSLQETVTSCRWVLGVSGVGRREIEERVEAALAADRLPVVRWRKGRQATDDVRPSVVSLQVAGGWDDGEGGTVDVVAELATQPRGLRPTELVTALATSVPTVTTVRRPADEPLPDPGVAHDGPRLRRACRTHQWIERDGSRLEPLSQGGGAAWRPARPAHAEERAS